MASYTLGLLSFLETLRDHNGKSHNSIRQNRKLFVQGCERFCAFHLLEIGSTGGILLGDLAGSVTICVFIAGIV